jgi:nucleoside-diphosphate-sugar epimerase
MRALIAGCGYVGLRVGTELARQGHEVCGLRRSDTGHAELRAAGLAPIVADIARLETLTAISPKFDWVICCASATGGGAERYRGVYVDGLRNLVAWLAAAPPKRFVYTSSTSVYGQTDGSIVDERRPTEPAEETARILVEAEEILLTAARERGFPGVVLRLAGIYGPGRGYWLKQFLRGEARLEGRGERVLNMIHREDAVSAIIAALHRGRPGEVYNVVDDEPVSQLVLFQWLSERLGRPLPPAGPEPGPDRRKRGATNKRISNRKLKLELCSTLHYPTFREGFEFELEHLPPTELPG